jgi:hypothetical protein
LLVVVLLAAPVGLIAYSLIGDTSLYFPRNLLPSLVPFAVLLGLGVDALPERLTTNVALVALTVGLAAGAFTTLGSANRRPPLRAVAAAVDAQARPEDRLVDTPLFLSSDAPLQAALRVHLNRAHPTFGLIGVRRFPGGAEAIADPGAWRTSGGRARVFVVGYEQPGHYLTPRPPRGSPYRVQSRRVYAGWVPLTLTVYVVK